MPGLVILSGRIRYAMSSRCSEAIVARGVGEKEKIITCNEQDFHEGCFTCHVS